MAFQSEPPALLLRRASSFDTSSLLSDTPYLFSSPDFLDLGTGWCLELLATILLFVLFCMDFFSGWLALAMVWYSNIDCWLLFVAGAKVRLYLFVGKSEKVERRG